MNAFRAMRRLESGDIDEAVRSIEHSLTMARVWKSQSGMVEHLVGYSITLGALYRIRSFTECPIPEQRRALLAMLKVVKSIENPPPLSRPLQGERLALLEMYQSVFTGIPPRDDSMTIFPPA